MPLIDQPIIVPINDREFWLAQAYQVEFEAVLAGDKKPRPYRLTIPQGFISDVASVPRLFWSLTGITPDGLYRAAALVHDYLYAFRGFLPKGVLEELAMTEAGLVWRPSFAAFGRQEADQLFFDLMLKAGVDGWKRALMYRAVRWFGAGPW